MNVRSHDVLMASITNKFKAFKWATPMYKSLSKRKRLLKTTCWSVLTQSGSHSLISGFYFSSDTVASHHSFMWLSQLQLIRFIKLGTFLWRSSSMPISFWISFQSSRILIQSKQSVTSRKLLKSMRIAGSSLISSPFSPSTRFCQPVLWLNYSVLQECQEWLSLLMLTDSKICWKVSKDLNAMMKQSSTSTSYYMFTMCSDSLSLLFSSPMS